MMIEEFIKRTGFKPMPDEYSEIEKEYMESDLDKEKFCEEWLSKGFLEIYIDRRAARISTLEHEVEKITSGYENKLKDLTDELERELEWKLYDDDENMSYTDYREMASQGYARKLTDNEAIEMINEEFGFEKDKIQIVKEINIYEKNRHGKLRIRKTQTRIPLYCSSDWNYIRFSCCGIVYEMINGDLRAFVD